MRNCALKWLTFACIVAAAPSCVAAPEGTAQAPAAAPAPACALSSEDRAWIDRALEAWRFVSREIVDVGAVNSTAVFFDASCTLTGEGALSLMSVDEISWTAVPHQGRVRLPTGAEIRARVIQFQDAAEGINFFVMPTPSFWRASGITGGGLEETMVAVLLHEASHAAQTQFTAPSDALGERHPTFVNDESLQERFQGNPEFRASIARETELFVAAARAADDADARRLAREARALMRARASRWYTGEEAWWGEAEDLGLTLEGSGQWLAYSWLVHPQGTGEPAANVENRLVRDRQWSQAEGFALAMAVNRIVGPGWLQQVFSADGQTLLAMLDAALAAGG